LAMGETEFREKDYDDAIKHYQKALKQKPKDAKAQHKLGLALLYVGRELEGAKHLQLAVRYGYSDPEVLKRLGYLYKQHGKRRAAINAFKKYLQRTKGKNIPPETQREMLRQIKQLGG